MWLIKYRQVCLFLTWYCRWSFAPTFWTGLDIWNCIKPRNRRCDTGKKFPRRPQCKLPHFQTLPAVSQHSMIQMSSISWKLTHHSTKRYNYQGRLTISISGFVVVFTLQNGQMFRRGLVTQRCLWWETVHFRMMFCALKCHKLMTLVVNTK